MNRVGSKPKHKVGDVVGRLTIIERCGSTPTKQALWRCKCECGNEIIRPGSQLGKIVHSCGCLRKEAKGNKSKRWVGCGDLPGSYWNQLTRNADARHVELSMTMKDGWDQFQRQMGKCALTGLPLTFSSTTDGVYRSNHGTASLDRIDSTKGYIPGNVHWVHKDINIMKKNHSPEYFTYLCTLVVANRRDLGDNVPID